MLFSALPHFEKRKQADVLVIPFWSHLSKAKCAAVLGKWDKHLQAPLDSKDFKGTEGEILLHYLTGEDEKRVILLGLGPEDKITVNSLRKTYGTLTRFCYKKKYITVNLVLPTLSQLRHLSPEECLLGIGEGILLANYQWDRKTEDDSKKTLLKNVHLIGMLPKALPTMERLESIAEAVYFARDLINGSADVITPKYLAEAAKKLSGKFSSLKTTIFDQKRLEKEKMGLILAVGKGSSHEPYLIQISYHGNPNSKDHTVLVGKGVTFDTGGLNLKPHASMETMRDDMSGGACVLGTLAAIASLKLKVNVTGVVPAVENATDANSFKPGDVYESFSGKTVEIGDTDAEGRLILADAISYSVSRLKPTQLIDIATLTGSIMVALGEEIAGLMSNNDPLAKKIEESAKATAEHVWRMPLYQAYNEKIKSDIADLKNVGGRQGGAIIAALFLEHFVEKIPWAHLDIAPTAFNLKERDYLPKNGIGFGIRFLVHFLSKI